MFTKERDMKKLAMFWGSLKMRLLLLVVGLVAMGVPLVFVATALGDQHLTLPQGHAEVDSILLKSAGRVYVLTVETGWIKVANEDARVKVVAHLRVRKDEIYRDGSRGVSVDLDKRSRGGGASLAEALIAAYEPLGKDLATALRKAQRNNLPPGAANGTGQTSIYAIASVAALNLTQSELEDLIEAIKEILPPSPI